MNKSYQLRLLASLIMISVMVIVSFSLLREIDEFWASNQTERITVAENAIKQAALQCYALEGSYPSNLSYLVENYGLRLNEDKYNYKYSAFAANIMPEIVVLEKLR